MSNMKRQSSWQEDIARNFSRLFQRTKSQDPGKTEESNISGQENAVSSSLSSETNEGEPSLHQEDLELSKAFQGTEEEANGREEGVLGEALEDEESERKEKGGEGSSSISDDAGGSSEDQPLVPPPLVDSVTCSLVSPLGPGSPTPPPPLDAFFRRLGSLFHFKAEPARGAQHQEEQQQAEEGGEGQEEEETALVVVSIEPDLSGMTCGAVGDQDHCDSAGRLTGNKDTRHTETENRRAGESDLHGVATSTRSQTHTDLETLEELALEETQTEGHREGCTEGEAAADSGPLREGEAEVYEYQRRLALACPPVVTYGTYRSQRDRRRMRRRHQVQVDFPISEGDEALHGRGSTSGGEGSPLGGVTPSTLELTISKQSDIQTMSTNQIRAPTSETNERGAWTSKTDSAVLGPTGLGSSHIPLTTETAERAGSQSAFPLPREAGLPTVGAQAKDFLSGVGSVTGSPPPHAPTEDSVDARTSTAGSETHSGEQSPRDRITHTEMASEDTHRDRDRDRDTGLMEQTETLSAHCVQTGSPSLAAAAWLSEPPGAGGTAQRTHLPAGVSDVDGGQLAPHPISPSASLASVAKSQGPMPATMHSDSGDVLDSGAGAGLHCFESGEDEGDAGPSDNLFDEALHLESKVMVDNILRNALAAQERIESSELEGDEVLQKASEETYLVLSVGREEGGMEQSFEPDKLLEVRPSERGDDKHPSAFPAEQTLSLNPNPLAEGPRSTPSSGYESIAGSDIDIRSSPGPACETSAPTICVSDHRQGEHCAEGTPGTGHQVQVKGQQLMDANANEHPQGEEDSQPNKPITCEYSGDKHQGDVLPRLSGGVSFEKPGIHGDSGDIIQIMRASHEYESVSGKTNENKDQVLGTLGDNGYNEVLGVKETQVGDGAVHVAKDDIESNRHSPKQDGNAQYGPVSVSNNSESPNKLNSTLNDNTSFRNQTAFPEPDLLRKGSKHEAKGNSEADLMSVRPKHTQNLLQPSQVRHAKSLKPIACITLHDEGQESGPEITLNVPQTETNGPNDTTVNGDQSFALVETFLASVVSEGSDSGGEEDGADSRPTGTICVDPSSSRRLPTDLSTSEGLESNSAPGSGNKDMPQRSSVRAYRCDVSPQQQSQDSETPGHGGAGSAAAMAGFHQDLSSRLAGLHATGATGGRRVPALEPLLPVPQLAFHDMEASGFSIIDEEEETDAVFVNDTGPMLSPTARRAKAYPFSLSPIVEEDSLRSEEAVEGSLSWDDRGLMVPPATEELRSLSGGVGMEQLASSSSLSILSLLQSVSERLQSSGYSDMDADLEEPSTPPLRRPLWDFFNRGQAEGEEGDDQGMDGDQSSKQEGPGSLTLPTDPFTMGLREGDPTEDLNNLSTPQITIQKPADSPMYQYLKLAQPVLPEPDDDNSKHHAKLVPCLRNNKCPSTATDMGGNWSCGKVIPRPTLMNIYDGVTFSGEMWEIHTDQEDSGMVFLQGASVRVLGGCWLLYLEPGFRGPWVLLEEGETVLSHQPGQQQVSQGTENKPTTITIGSIRRLVKDDGTPEIHLLLIGAPGGATEHLHSEVDILGTYGGPIHLSNLTVKSGCWLAYDNPGFHGNYAVMEAGGSPTSGAGHPQVTAVRSLRPLRMRGLRVRRPLDPKLLVFEQPLFQGRGRELGNHTPSLGAVAGLKGALSLRVIGGVWVGYTGEDYTGWQYLLEEGEYSDCADLGGADRSLLLSFRFLQAEFIEPSVSLQEETGCSGAGRRDILDLDVPDLEKAGATETTAISVKSGVWVAYSERCFSGEQYILEKGKHPATLHWGGNYGAAKSIRPIRLDLCGTGEPMVLLRAYSQPHYGGMSEQYEGEAGHCGSASPMSFRVIRGNWLLFDEDGYCGNQYVLGEGLYPDLISCGCVATSVKSLRPIPYSFSDPSISLFSLDSFEGLKMVAVTPTEHIKDFFTQSLRVDSGLWVVYEYSNYKGRQMLLQPGELPVWGEHSGWDTIGSLRPLKQPRLYVHVRSRALGSVLTSESVQDDLSLARVSLSPACSLDTQRWLFTGGLLCCKASKACLSVIGGKATVGARVALWAEHGRTHQRWSLNHNGTISSHLNHKLVLEFRGGTGFERDHLVVNEFAADQATQFWDMELV